MFTKCNFTISTEGSVVYFCPIRQCKTGSEMIALMHPGSCISFFLMNVLTSLMNLFCDPQPHPLIFLQTILWVVVVVFFYIKVHDIWWYNIGLLVDLAIHSVGNSSHLLPTFSQWSSLPLKYPPSIICWQTKKHLLRDHHPPAPSTTKDSTAPVRPLSSTSSIVPGGLWGSEDYKV